MKVKNGSVATAVSRTLNDATYASVMSEINETVIELDEHTVTMADEASTVGYGGSSILTFPAGNILVLGATANLTLRATTSGINADWDGDFGIGSVTASNNATLSSTEQNVIPTTATPQAASSRTTAKGGSTAVAFLDGTSTAASLFLNILVDDADHDIGGTACDILASGKVKVFWINLGDY